MDSFFFDEDGKAYIVNNDDAPDNKPEYSGHRTIRVQEFDVNADKTVGPRKILVYAWVGQWKGRSKKKSTYRGIKIGSSTSKVKKKYGEFTLKKCTKKDPFTRTKGLKKSKVKKYTDMKYGKYRIRFYFDKKNKVAAIIYSCNLSRIKKRALKKYM